MYLRLWETLIERDYERRCLNETMRDTDCTRLWETLIVRNYERHWLYETMRDTTCLKDAFTMLSIWFVQFPSDAKANPTFLCFFTISTSSHWLCETMRDTDCTRLWETLIERVYERHWLYETMRDTDW
jgi:hypothetical protein